MIRPSNELPVVYLCTTPVDFRKGIGGLSTLVEATLSLNPFSEHLFVFCNRKHDRVKVLYWERSGFCLWLKQLEKERFHWPDGDNQAILQVTGQQLNWLLDGYDISRMSPHKSLCFSSLL